jgi:catechol 2,3-dioxygenase-like lactoylglutathione lyase family enzyme
VLTHFIVASDVARSRDFYTGVLGGTVVLDGHLIEVGQTTGVLPER